MLFKKWLSHYNTRNSICGSLGRVYHFSNDNLDDVLCMKWDCAKCRPLLKYIYFLEVLKNVHSFKLYRHFVITFPGSLRKNVSWEDSYKVMSEEWNKFKQIIEYHFGPIDYIQFARAQKSGYCHYHTLTSKWLNWKWLDIKRHKSNLGFVSIQKNYNTAEYLAKDYFKDHEWCIPSSLRHFRTSRGILLNNFQSSWCHYFPNNVKLDDIEFYIKSMYNPNFDLFYYNFESYVKKHIIEEI